QRPWGQPVNRYLPLELLSSDEIEAIHNHSLRILEEIGIVFHSPKALSYFRGASAKVGDGGRVFLGREIIEDALRSVGRRVRLVPRNEARAVTVSSDCMAFATVLGPPNCSDLKRGRRPGTLADFSDFIRLAQYFNVIHLLAGSPVEPTDVPVPLRHLESTRRMLELSDKVPYVFCHSRRRVLDVLEMIAIARGMTLEALADSPSTYSIINSNSPLQYDRAMADGLIELAEFGQLVIITPFSVAGASMPIALAGATALANAEMLAGLVLTQLVRPGAPVVSGAKTVPADMRTGSLADASPEANKALQIGAQLARRYDLPYRAACFTNSNAPDAQAGYESQSQLWAAVTAGSQLLMHAAGWLETGLCASFEKFVLDVDMLQAICAYLEPVEVDDRTLAFEEIAEVGPGGHYFATPSTLCEFETAFYRPLVFEGKNYEQWQAEGAPQAAERAHELYRQVLDEFETPRLSPERQEALDAFVKRRSEDGGAPLE
ncbi:MAG: trimethylamine methyltransferase family protein, partial [Kiloniellales bacterium]|nr:trimethylamine methyltransferase family protein [Kiloniellales bacterium]